MCNRRFFHFTDQRGVDAVRASGKLKQSKNAYSHENAAFGDGIYCTKKSPWWHTKKEIALNNWCTQDPQGNTVDAGLRRIKLD
jgi:hypothetical protein